MTAVRHTGIVVADLDSAVRFWSEGFGFSEEVRADESGPVIDAILGLDGVDLTTVKMVAPDGGRIELLRFGSHPSSGQWTGSEISTGPTHVALTVSDLDAVCQRITELGAEVRPVQQSLDGRVRLTYCRGPEGLLLELVEELA